MALEGGTGGALRSQVLKIPVYVKREDDVFR